MSHGQYNKIEMADGRCVVLEPDLLRQFSLDEFRGFAGKPKIFIVEACQAFNEPPPPKDPPAPAEPRRSYVCPDYSDILLCMPTLSGYLAFRHASRGTVFITQMCRVFSEYACFMDLQQMLTEVRQVY